MRRLLIAAALTALSLSTDAAAQSCTTPQPGPIAGQSWVCHNGGWLPPALAPTPAPLPPAPAPAPPTFDQPQPKRAFFLGHRYTRGTTDVRIVGSGQMPGGVSVLFALCNEEGDGCFYQGMIRSFLANADSSDWTNHGPY